MCTLAKTLEPFENRFKGTEFNALCTNTTMLFNNIGARHALKSDDKVSFQFMTMKKEDLEKWYDNAFQMFLACMSVLPYLDVKGKLKTIKSGKENNTYKRPFLGIHNTWFRSICVLILIG